MQMNTIFVVKLTLKNSSIRVLVKATNKLEACEKALDKADEIGFDSGMSPVPTVTGTVYNV